MPVLIPDDIFRLFYSSTVVAQLSIHMAVLRVQDLHIQKKHLLKNEFTTSRFNKLKIKVSYLRKTP